MTDRTTVMAVIRYLGRLAVVLALGDLVLTWRVLDLAGKAGQVDPVAVGAVAAITTLLGTVLGALGAMLVSTRSVPEGDDQPVPVTVTNEAADAVPVDVAEE